MRGNAKFIYMYLEYRQNRYRKIPQLSQGIYFSQKLKPRRRQWSSDL
jgi:hypothetical protein